MDKVELLRQAAQRFHSMLSDLARQDRVLKDWLEELDPLFQRVEVGEVVPPALNLFRWPFHPDDIRHGSDTGLYSAAAEFRAALEDWRSQPWAQAAYQRDDRGR